MWYNKSIMEPTKMLEEQEEQLDLVQSHEKEDYEEEVPLMDIRQMDFWDKYLKPSSKTYGNALASALAAKYSESFSNNITSQKWFKKKILRMNLLNRAEKVIKKTLTMKTMDDEGKEQADLLRIQVDAAKHVTKTLGKDEGWSDRTEITGKDGSQIVFMPTELLDKYAIPTEAEDITNKEEK